MCLVGGKRAAGPCPSLPEDTEHCQHVAEREASKGGVDPKKQMKTGENLGQRMLFPLSPLTGAHSCGFILVLNSALLHIC